MPSVAATLTRRETQIPLGEVEHNHWGWRLSVHVGPPQNHMSVPGAQESSRNGFLLTGTRRPLVLKAQKEVVSPHVADRERGIDWLPGGLQV